MTTQVRERPRCPGKLGASLIEALGTLATMPREPQKDYYIFVHEKYHWPSVEKYAKDINVSPVEKDGHTCYFLGGAFVTKAHPAKHIQGYGQ